MPKGGARAGAGRKAGETVPKRTLSLVIPEEVCNTLYDRAAERNMSINAYLLESVRRYNRTFPRKLCFNCKTVKTSRRLDGLPICKNCEMGKE